MSLARSFMLVAALMPAAAMAGQDHLSDNPPGKVSFYFAAHEDDWQLFMNPTAFEDVNGAASKTIFVHVTAGDDGLGVGTGGRRRPYYLARENGALEAMRFMADSDKTPVDDSAGPAIFNGHPIFRVSYLNTIGYFLRVPDGNGTGEGFAGTGFQSLKRFAAGKIATLTAIDGSTTYHGWSDLVATVREILAFERGAAPRVQLNVADPDARLNPGDHSDHLMTAKMALAAADKMNCVRRAYYVDYASSKLPINLTGQERDMEGAVFAVTLAGVMAFDHETSWHHYDESYIGRNYFRVDEPAGPCGLASSALAAKH